MTILLSFNNKKTGETTIGKIDDNHLLSTNPTCYACSKDMSEHDNKNITKFRTNQDYYSFKLLIENEDFKTIFATKGKNSTIGLFAEECLSSLSKYKVGMIVKLKKDSKELSFITKKSDNEFENENYPNSCFAIEQMISKGFIKKD